MNTVESLILSALLNSLWQIPLLCAAGWIVARVMRPAGPAVEHRVWVGVLFAEVLLPALSVIPWKRFHWNWPWLADAGYLGNGNVTVQMSPGNAVGALQIPPMFLTALVLAYVLCIFYFAGRFLRQCAKLKALVNGAQPIDPDGPTNHLVQRVASRFGIGSVLLLSSRRIFAPVTMGVLRKRILLPARMMVQLPQADLETAIAHELAHIRRRDFLKNLLYEVLTLPVSYHPCTWFARQQVAETREMICDEMAAEATGTHEYAQSLLRLATMLLEGGPVRVPQAIGVFDTNTLERRLMKLTEKKTRVGRLRLYVSLGACLAFGIATAASALAMRVAVDSHAANSDAHKKGSTHSVPAGVMAQRLLNKVTPKYPPEAKKARIQGKVVLQAIVGKDGKIEQLHVMSGPKELQQSALDAVRQWIYTPFLLNGAPVEVETTINVIYTLAK
jgi:TonB family protein